MKVAYSKEATININDSLYSAFELNTYIARCIFEDGFVVMLVLPKNAAEKPPAEWDTSVRLAANFWRDQDARFYPDNRGTDSIARLLP